MEIKNIKIRASSDYPKIVNAEPCLKTIGIIQDLLAYNKGEIAAIMQYFYQSVISKEAEKDVAELLEEISVVEMHHMELLMEAIVAFGGNPKYNNSKGYPFNANYVNYAPKLKEMLEANISGELQAIADYTRAKQLVKNQSLKLLFDRIIEDEQMHVDAFKTLLSKVKFLTI